MTTRKQLSRALALGLSVWVCSAALLAHAHAQEELRTPPDRQVDITRISLTLDVDLASETIAGHADLELTALRSLGSVSLDAVDHEIQGVFALPTYPGAGEPRELPHDYDGQRLRISIDLARGDQVYLRVVYQVREPTDGLFFFGPTADAPDVPWQAWTQGEPVSNRHWFPCLDNPEERQASAMHVRVKQGLTVISNGTLMAVEDEPLTGSRVWHFEQQREHPAYLFSLIVGTFDEAHDEWRGRPLGYYVPPGRAADAERSFARTKDMLDLFSDLTGVDYPWTKYDQTVVEQFSAGGMENTGATTLNERTLHDARAHLDYSSEGLVAHELAHQWFGDLITCREWAHLWLNESFATYFAVLWEEHHRGPTALDLELLDILRGGLRSGNDRPIVDRRWPSPGSMFDGRAYPKGACVLHMLRRQLGEEAFWRGVRRYVRTCMDGPAETDDLRRALEGASGRNLERFFYDWLERPGHPSLEVRLEHDAERGLAVVTIAQTQDGEPYHFPAELVLRFGEREVRRTIDVRQATTTFALPTSEAPTWFRFDPREQVLLKEVKVHKPRDLWLAQLQDDGTIGRIHAARHLRDDRHPQARDALLRGLREDAERGVRSECAQALRGHAGDEVTQALVQALVAEESPHTRRDIVEVLGRRGPSDDLADLLAELLERGDPSYYVEAAAVEAYARLAREPRAVLEAQLTKRSHNEVILQAALRALGEAGDPDVVPLLIELTRLGDAPSVRHTAARALSVAGLPGCSQELRDQAVEALTDLLRTSRARGRRAALDGLSSLSEYAGGALAQVEGLAESDPSGWVRTSAEATAERIRSGAPANQELARLREETRRLQRETDDLAGRLELLEAAAIQAAADADSGGE
jgi:aminopeptidase N